MSSFSKVSKSTFSFIGSGSKSVASLAFLVSSSFFSCASITLSSIFSKSSDGSLSCFPAASISMLPSCSHEKLSNASMSLSFLLLKGRNGSKAIARLADNCRHILRIVATRSASALRPSLLTLNSSLFTPLATFQGSHSVIYLLPMRARFIASFWASRNLNCSRYVSTSAFTFLNSSMACLSVSVSSPHSGTTPLKYFFVSCRARFTKFP